LGDQAYAEANQLVPSKSDDNSQTISLLQANVSSAITSKDKNEKDSKKGNQIDENSDIKIVSGNAMLPSTGPLGVSGSKNDPSSADQISVYVIREGDSISQIADMFGVSVNTILWANDMKKGDKLVPGDVLFVLPVSGVEHTVVKGQTIQSIAKFYKADAQDIAIYNGFSEDTKLTVGDKLIIPDGEMADEGGDKPAPNLKQSEAKDKTYYSSTWLNNVIGYFVNPLPTGHKTQGLHGPGHRGIDIGAPTGTNLYASASGVVIAVKTGCKVGYSRCGGGYGNMAIVQHPNGTKTLYAHMSKVLTSTGASVERGEKIGLVGSTGRSTGPHIHFEVFNAKNPGADWSWAK
jgi:LysM repeat protein